LASIWATREFNATPAQTHPLAVPLLCRLLPMASHWLFQRIYKSHVFQGLFML